MKDDTEKVKSLLTRRHLGKRGIHGIKIDKQAQAVEIYVDEDADIPRAVGPVQKDSGDLVVRATRSRRARLA